MSVDSHLMFFHVTWGSKHSSANLALEHPHLFVNTFNVDIPCHLPGKLLLANVTLVPPYFIVHFKNVSSQLNLERISFVAMLADKLFDAEMNRVDVLGQDINWFEILVAPVARMALNIMHTSNVGSETDCTFKHPFTNVAGPETKTEIINSICILGNA